MSSHLIIYDWDDTLFPTSWMKNNNIDIENDNDIRKYKLYFNDIDNSLYKLLIISLKFAKVIIISNAQKRWIYKSAQLCLPKTSKLIKLYIKIISANENYSNFVNINQWKICAFNNDIENYINSSRDIINIGDALYEYEALLSLKHKYMHYKYLKNIKLVKDPTFNEIIDQQSILMKTLPKICVVNRHIDLNFKNLS